MNPSAAGWILKFLNVYDSELTAFKQATSNEFYQQLLACGFIYGISVNTVSLKKISTLQLSNEEFTKVNLFQALLVTSYKHDPTLLPKQSIEHIIQFYKQLDKGKKRFLHKLSLSQSTEQNLEKILSARIQERNSVLKKDAASLLTYALLYADVLAFRYYLTNPNEVKEYARQLELAIINACVLALQSKKNKKKYDLLLLELFESSSDYLHHQTDQSPIDTLEHLSYLKKEDDVVKKYIIDLCCLAIWDDKEMNTSEFQFLQQLAVALQQPEGIIETSIEAIKHFAETNATNVQLFKYSNPVQQFYKQSSKTVKTLILRNKNRLVKELSESGELMVLLGQSTFRDLSKEEKNKVKEQLLDICKSIPSLTIFLLPGGTLLLPLLVKFIPKLLPSAFHENRIEVKKEKERND